LEIALLLISPIAVLANVQTGKLGERSLVEITEITVPHDAEAFVQKATVKVDKFCSIYNFLVYGLSAQFSGEYLPVGIAETAANRWKHNLAAGEGFEFPTPFVICLNFTERNPVGILIKSANKTVRCVDKNLLLAPVQSSDIQ
jgi:hypothetical protein